ncbi:MAG: alkaline phosphatase family protein [Anaerolineae bacterium]|nr:alkaline phosphatase family protein [Anaerolineae bacterium]
MSREMKTIVIGLDGATFDLILPWVEEGKLPNLAKIMRHGAWGNLASVPNMISPAAWGSFLTGKNPAKHGIFYFRQRAPGSYQRHLINGSYRHGKTFMELLSEAGKQVGMMHVLTTYPVQPVNGFWIGGIGAPSPESEGFAYPVSVLQDIVRNVGEYILLPQFRKELQAGRFDVVLERIRETLDYRAKAALYAMDNYDWEHFTVVFDATDTVQHHFWKYLQDPELDPSLSEAIYSIYHQSDTIIGEILSRVDQDTVVIIMSDHGAGFAQHGPDYLNRFLAELGMLYFVHHSHKRSWLERLVYKGYNLFHNNAGRNLKGKMLSLFPQLYNRLQSRLAFSGIDWAATRAFADRDSKIWRSEVWINVKGREPSGTVEPGEEYETLRNKIIDVLMQATDPITGLPVVTKVEKKEDIYNGPFIDSAADLLIHWTYEFPVSGLCYTTPEGHRICVVDEGERETTVESGSHRQNGILFMYGNPIKEGYHLVGAANIVDVAPTILYLMGQPIPTDMDGHVVFDAFHDSYRQEMPLRTVDTGTEPVTDHASLPPAAYDEKEQSEVEDRLRALGYIE